MTRTMSTEIASVYAMIGRALSAGEAVRMSHDTLSGLHALMCDWATEMRRLERLAAGDCRPDVLAAAPTLTGDNFRPAEPDAAASLVAFAATGGPRPCAVVLPFPRGGHHGR